MLSAFPAVSPHRHPSSTHECLRNLSARNTRSRVVVQWAAKVFRHRCDLCSHGIDQGHRQVDDLSKLRGETTGKGLVDQTQSIVTQVSVELAILDVSAEVEPVEVVTTHVAAEEDRLDSFVSVTRNEYN